LQAQRTGGWLAGRPLDAVYSSPLLRARQTAEAIACRHGLEPELVDDLIEVDVGLWEGRSWEEIERTDSEAYRLFMTDATVHPYLGGENLSVVAARAVPAMERLAARNVDRTIAVVAHNVVNRLCLAHLLKSPLARYRSIPQDNCGVNLLRYEGGEMRPVTINAIEHLSG
jgi:broad specificity phosphatase PhoE